MRIENYKRSNGLSLETRVIITIIVFAITGIGYFCMNGLKFSQIKKYKYLESNGQTYKTDDMADITRDYLHNEQTFIITMNDGSKIYINDYSLHD